MDFVGDKDSIPNSFFWSILKDHEQNVWFGTRDGLYQYNAATQTARTPNDSIHATDYLQLSPKDAAGLGLADGETVRLRSEQGSADLPVKISDRVKDGEVYTTFHSTRVFLNQITTSHRDRYTKTPEYKITAVCIEKLEPVAAK